ncbi:chitobiosyldiphosphodolichol beta-mannosyltransferase-like [Diachasmimorpha longicaudata]|uniref:chitobiosyldiphosphodolichol beta-mannosyltransferase-like n=1 Tax=Diachasmimorpha longicaudata TaxID=58733 RepID=UPI0030B8C27A
MEIELYFILLIPLFSALVGILCLRKKGNTKSVCIVVLGDIGRSPRMQYHGISFLKEGFNVDIVGYAGSQPLEDLQKHQNVRIRYLKPVPMWNDRLPKLLSYIFKTLWQSATLIFELFKNVRSRYLMIQNPPAIPTIPICWLFCRLSATRFVIDWHNYAHTIMALSIGQENFLVKITMFIEGFFGARADHNYCVTKAMKEDLKQKWKITATVLYDRPPEEFKSIDLIGKHNLLIKLGKKYETFRGKEEGTTVLTEVTPSEEIRLRRNRPALVVSSTSWTEDEDFSILFQALAEYEIACCSDNSNLPDMICVITGKGPLKTFWDAIIDLRKWKHVRIVTPWLENKDYPKLLASADLGVCLHTSSSGLDLPMKVVDMFGCGLPVCAYNYKCLNELVKHEENSLVFTDYDDLSQQLIYWFTKFPNHIEQLERESKFRNELKSFQQMRWHGNWSTLFVNERPIIGILTQELSYRMAKIYGDEKFDSYLAASYVKYVESAGARAVPIWIGQPTSYYEAMLNSINGILLPGGSSNFGIPGGYSEAGQIIYRIATEMNDHDDYFPIWGTCLGFELLTYLAAKGTDQRTNCSSSNQILPLIFKPGFMESRMFENAPSDVIDILKKEKVTANFHRYCVTEEDLARAGLTSSIRVLSVNRDWNGLEFVSSLEHVSYPFYGVQFHPEKNMYEWLSRLTIPHGRNAIRVSQYFADFLVAEARKSQHRFQSLEEESKHLIYNYIPEYTGLQPKSSFEQIYLFKKKPHGTNNTRIH